MSANLVVLLHWPILGPTSLRALAAELERRGHPARVPDLHAHRDHLESARAGLADLDPAQPLLLVTHSGAIHLLPSLRRMTLNPVTGYVVMDGSLPENGLSRLDLTVHQDPQVGIRTREKLDADGATPLLDAFAYAELVPDPDLRRAMMAEHQAQGRPYWEDPITVPEGWPEAPAAYISSSPGYVVFADLAQKSGWTVRKLEGGTQFDPILRPGAVADTIVELEGVLAAKR